MSSLSLCAGKHVLAFVGESCPVMAVTRFASVAEFRQMPLAVVLLQCLERQDGDENLRLKYFFRIRTRIFFLLNKLSLYPFYVHSM